MRASRYILACASVLLGACPSTSVYRTADPLDEGQWQVGAAVGVGGMADQEQDTSIPIGHVELSARRGIGHNVDIGAKLYVAGTEINATWRVHKAGWSYALAPSFAGVQVRESVLIPKSIHLFAGLTAIASRQMSDRWSLATGPLAGWGLYLPSTGGSAQGAWLGAFIHMQAKVGERWLLGPEITTYGVIAGEVPVRGGAIQLGFSLLRTL